MERQFATSEDDEVGYYMRKEISTADVCLCKTYGKQPRSNPCPVCGDYNPRQNYANYQNNCSFIRYESPTPQFDQARELTTESINILRAVKEHSYNTKTSKQQRQLRQEKSKKANIGLVLEEGNCEASVVLYHVDETNDRNLCLKTSCSLKPRRSGHPSNLIRYSRAGNVFERVCQIKKKRYGSTVTENVTGALAARSERGINLFKLKRKNSAKSQMQSRNSKYYNITKPISNFTTTPGVHVKKPILIGPLDFFKLCFSSSENVNSTRNNRGHIRNIFTTRPRSSVCKDSLRDRNNENVLSDKISQMKIDI